MTYEIDSHPVLRSELKDLMNGWGPTCTLKAVADLLEQSREEECEAPVEDRDDEVIRAFTEARDKVHKASFEMLP